MKTLGLDIGGANIKAAHSDGGAWSEPFALWKEPAQLAAQLAGLAAKAPDFDRLAVTTTAELCDCFETKRQGVNHVLDAVEALAAGRAVGVWMTDGRFAPPAEARGRPLLCAAANWHALATAAAAMFPAGLSLLIDTGSTTTDILRLHEGRVRAAGMTDMDRLATGELVYLGARRTPLMALGPTIEWRGKAHRVMAEYFATTADVYLLLGKLKEDEADRSTADGRPMLKRWAAARLVRMIGADMEQVSEEDTVRLAEAFSQRLVERVAEAVRQVLAGERPERVVLAGSGDFIAAAARGALPDVERVSLADKIGPEASAAACAWAVARLMDERPAG